MSALDRLLGLLCAFAYTLERSKAGFIRLRAGVIWSCLLSAAYTAFRAWRYGFAGVYAGVIGLCLLLATVLVWADRQRYLLFRAGPGSVSQAAPALQPEEKLLLRGSGVFEVSSMRRYLVQVPVVFWTTHLADHIVAAKVRAFNILGLGVPSDESGWWYIFVEPRRVTEIAPGELCFGLQSRPAVRVVCKGAKGSHVIYLTAEASQQVDRLLVELRARAEAAKSLRPPSPATATDTSV
jgi:hypothetical protein